MLGHDFQFGGSNWVRLAPMEHCPENEKCAINQNGRDEIISVLFSAIIFEYIYLFMQIFQDVIHYLFLFF